MTFARRRPNPDSLQLTSDHQVATPVDWNKGQSVIIVPSISNDDAKTTWPDGWEEVKPYLRLVPDPTTGEATT